MKLNSNKIAIILSVILTALCVISILCLIFYPKRNKSYTAYIYVDGVLYDSIPLNEVNTPYSFRIFTEDGHYNEIQVEYNSIGISAADCPNLLCVKQGPISNNLLPITCLPHHLVIELKTIIHPANQPDAITH